jgi:alkylation response protein AidB-like acyl-CoA dehydrogenase
VRLGLLQQLLETALGAAGKYARRLKLKGVPPQGYQMLGHKLADFKIRFDATELLLRRAAWQLERRGVAAAETALAGLAIETSLLPGAFEVVRLQRDYALDENQAWANLLSSVVEYGRYMLNPVQMRTSVNEAIQPGVA